MQQTGGIKQKVFEVAEPLVAICGCELVDVEYLKENGRRILRLIIYKKDGVSHEDCEAVSKLTGEKLDVLDLIKENYYLEVSSPGYDRPLKTKRDIERYKGEKVTVKLSAPVSGSRQINGILDGIEDGMLVITTTSGKQQFELEDVTVKRLLEF